MKRYIKSNNETLVEHAILELKTYRGTLFEESAECAISKLMGQGPAPSPISDSRISSMLLAFETFDNIANKFMDDSGIVVVSDFDYLKWDLMLNIPGHRGIHSSSMSNLQDFNFCYDEWYHQVIDLGIAPTCKGILKEFMQKNPGYSLDEYVDEILDGIAWPMRKDEFTVDEDTAKDFIKNIVKSTYVRNRR